MRYKVDYSPTYILDPDSYAWLSLDDDMLAKFNERGYLDLSPAGGADSPNSPQPESTPNVTKDEANRDPVAEDDDVDSLFTSGMPGMITGEQLGSFDLDQLRRDILMRMVLRFPTSVAGVHSFGCSGEEKRYAHQLPESDINGTPTDSARARSFSWPSDFWKRINFALGIDR
ncbi:hypothetical protein DL771_012388 [Monosporascus sp. 5C6A]|nr:hypothetical protein DL771_012388 [Monosporascus sp. 5C6A]